MKKLFLIGLVCLSLFGCMSFNKDTGQTYEYTITENKPHYKVALLWLAESIDDSKSSIEFQDEGMQVVNGSVVISGDIYDKCFDYTIKVTDLTVTVSCSNFRQGEKKALITKMSEYNSFKKDTSKFAESLFNYFDTYQ